MNPKLLPSAHDSTMVAPFMIDDRVFFFPFLILDPINNTVTRLLLPFLHSPQSENKVEASLGHLCKEAKGGLSLVFLYLEVLLVQALALVLSPH